MKNLIVSLFLLLILTGNLFAQQKEPSERNNLLSLSMPRLAMSNFSLTYERLFKNNTSAVITAGIILKDNPSNSKIGENFEFQYRFYSKIMREKAFQGVYFAPYLGYRAVELKTRYDYWDNAIQSTIQQITRENFSTLSGGVAVGCKIAIAHKVVFGFELGGGIKYSIGTRNNGNYNIFQYGYSGISPKGDISLGIFF